MSCIICCADYEKAPVICGFCDFAACHNCCENYILSESKPKCMNASCGKVWSRKFMKAQLGSSFMNDKFKQHMENILYERERGLMLATQPLVEKSMKENRMKKQLNEIKEQIKQLEQMKELVEINMVRFARGREPLEVWNDEIKWERYQTYDSADSVTNVKKHYVRTCPAAGCRGFLDNKWNCGICDANVCNRCHEIVSNSSDNNQHICNEENVATALLLEKETKPCPKCSAKIFKIDGCDQIWCTQCHTAFSWKTGAIETKIHNPHYYEWKRNNGGLEPVHINIGGGAAAINCMPNEINEYTHRLLNSAAEVKFHRNLSWSEIDPRSTWKTIAMWDNNFATMNNIIQNTIHNHEVELPKFTTDIIKNNEKYRIQFMSNEITEEKFKTLIQRNDKKSKKEAEIHDILQFAETTLSDIINRMIHDLNKSEPNKHNFQELFKEVVGLREYCNNIFADISETYDCVLYNLDNDFKFKSVKSVSDRRKIAEKLENKARLWLINETNRGVDEFPLFDHNKPTALREMALNLMNSKETRGQYLSAMWMERKTCYSPFTCDMYA